MPRPIHFEIQASDPKRAIAFYTALFGWTFSKWDGPQDYWLIKTGEANTKGIDGGLLPRRGSAPAAMQAVNAFVCTTDVADLDASLLRVGELGGTIVVPKMAIQTVGWLAYASDTEGNIFGMMKMDSAAK
ncbi:MAG TPA: VOC family protein [Casimicrobiaceae bacterium]|jgi:predicted enzyme related to lactoylglutathione lyase